MPTATEELGKLIGRNIRDTQDLNQSMSHSAGEDTNIIFPTDTFQVVQLTLRLTGNDIGTAFILGHPINGILGSGGVGLGAGTYNFIGEDWRVVSPNNTFWEYFATTNFKNTTDSTSTTDITNEEESFTSGQIYLTKRIFKNEEDINSVNPQIWIRSASNSVVIDNTKPAQIMNIYLD